jgi:hypothetical protein
MRIVVSEEVNGMAMAWITAWSRESFAEDWYVDAARNAAVSGDRGERRREIVFAACLAESYLYEWVRDQMFLDDEAALLAILPNFDRRGITERWKDVAKALHANGKIAKPDFQRPNWGDFGILVEYRNGLVHAAASRPVDVQKPSSIKPPTPSVSVLDGLDPGWATNTVTEEIRELHRLARTAPPAWLVAV